MSGKNTGLIIGKNNTTKLQISIQIYKCKIIRLASIRKFVLRFVIS